MNEERYVYKGGRRLRYGYTTGTCAAAAAKAAAWMLLGGERVESVRVRTPAGAELTLSLRDIRTGTGEVSCAVEKDGGDDPDVTTGTLIYAAVSLQAEPGIRIDGGKGVGRVTKPGLDQPVGAAAINSVPRQMIRREVEAVCRRFAVPYAEDSPGHGGLLVVVSVPDGERLAQKTFNPRLGIVGGISILGTSGLVEPMSDQALIDTIAVELRQRRESGADFILLTPGNYGLNYLEQSLSVNPALPVRVSNFIGDAVEQCAALGFHGALLVGHIGKLVKLAGGIRNTHSRFGDCRMELTAAHAGACGLDAARIAALLDCATVDDALRILTEAGLREAVLARLTARIAETLRRWSGETLETGVILFSNTAGLLGESDNARRLMEQIRGE